MGQEKAAERVEEVAKIVKIADQLDKSQHNFQVDSNKELLLQEL